MSEDWEHIQSLFLHAVELRPEERGPFLDVACVGDAEMRREIESLLAHDGASEKKISDALQGTAHSLFQAATITPGTTLGDYEVEKLIGSGGMGEVYQAHDTRLKRDVAIKVLPPLFRYEPDRLQRFEQEARAAAALNHPNILAVYHLGSYEGSPYLVSELLEGSTLRELMKRGPLPVRNAIDYGVQIARGLAAAHEKGITHRDLKPENIFVATSSQVKILDFGLAKLTHAPRDSDADNAATEAGLIVGTVGYMSPEQVRGQAADYRADIFAFGVILYEMLCGKRAFEKPTSAETMSAILNEDPPGISQLLPTVPSSLQRVVHRCLEKNREQRFQSASDLAFALETPSDAISGSASAIQERERSRNLGWFALVAAIVIVAIGVWWWRSPKAMPKVEAVRQLTEDGETKATTLHAAQGSLATDGTRVYFNERQVGSWRIVQVSATGGQTAPLAAAVDQPVLTAIDPSFSNLLTLNGWLVPIPAGNPRRLGDFGKLDVTGAEYFPDGQHIVYAYGSAIYTADKDGANSRKLLEVPGEARWLSVSPDGGRIRFTLLADTEETIWEIKSDGTGKHEVLNGWKGANFACCGRWTKDGQYFVFLGIHKGASDIWALPEEKIPFGGPPAIPTQLTNGPLSYFGPVPSPDNKTLFALGTLQKGELTRFNTQRAEFVPFLGSLSATHVMSSRDGQWIIFLSYPEHVLWRSRADGSDRMQLSTGRAFFPNIAPDGSKAVFVAFDPEKGLGAYVVSMQGGTAQRVVDQASFASWAPDSSQLVVQISAHRPDEPTPIQTANVQSGEVHTIPDSFGQTAPFWPSPDVLVMGSPKGLVIFDLKTQKWTTLVPGDIDNWSPSWDGKYVYFEKADASSRKAFRMSLEDRRAELVADLSGIKRVEQYGPGAWLGVTADGSLLITRDVGTQEIYALDVKWP